MSSSTKLAALLLVSVWAANGGFMLVNLVLAAATAEPPPADEFILNVIWVPAMAGSPADPAAAEPVESARKPASPYDAARICRTWGPFDDPAEAEALAQTLGVAAADYELVEEPIAEAHDHLVRVRGAGSRADAQRVRQELLEHGIESYLLQPGEEGHALAAGVFSSLSRAENQQRRLIDLGYDAAIEPLERRRQEYHLLARVPADVDTKNTQVGRCSDIAPMRRFL